MSSQHFDVVIVAAGSSSRFGKGSLPKQFVQLNGLPLFLWSVKAFLPHPSCARMVIATQKSLVSEMRSILLADKEVVASGKAIEVIEGGEERQDSVRNSLAAVRKLATGWCSQETINGNWKQQGATAKPGNSEGGLMGSQFVMIHDAARPLVDQTLIERVWNGRVQADGVVPGVILADTVKQVTSDGFVQQTLDRSTLRLAQTPQLFKTSVIYDLHLRAQNESGGEGGAFDDAVLAETMGLKILIVEGSQRNMKVTYPEDFEIVSHWARN